ncbi:phospholipase D-like domain-containing protein [Methylonatrum kenyense]|uniref:phospholipase D-like domain-containing protein n=1 Tax=Methylonatrum kenyense TaxID=455253 RepID=UPI0020BF6C9A|nr:phospholipase D-like domain-containing protein [Methylonatrum kenyense]MCK8515132.1 phospholipase D-like domain-containing protein [Methylonatrum kenyense]
MTRRGKWFWLLAAVAVMLTAAILVVIAANATPKAMRLEQPLSLDYGPDDPRFARTVQAAMQQAVVPGNRIEMLQNGDEIYPAMLSAIDDAEYSITFEKYEFWGEESGARFAEALAEAARRGVRVHVLLDFIGSTAADQEALDRMQEAGVELIRWRAPSWYQAARFNHRTHRKLMIVDGNLGFTGGANIGDDWLGTPETGGKRDNHFRLRGPVVGQLQAAFAENWLNASGRMLEGDSYYPPLDAEGELAMQVVDSAPREGRHRVRMLFLYAIAAARERIDMGTAYFYPDTDFLAALADAADRGVRVRILVPGDSIDKGFVRHASVNQWRDLLEAGVEIHEYGKTMYHSKLVAVDDAWASIGSTNLDNRSFRINDEVNVNVFDADFARSIRETIDADKLDSELYDLERWENRPWHKRIAGWISMTLGSHF